MHVPTLLKAGLAGKTIQQGSRGSAVKYMFSPEEVRRRMEESACGVPGAATAKEVVAHLNQVPAAENTRRTRPSMSAMTDGTTRREG